MDFNANTANSEREFKGLVIECIRCKKNDTHVDMSYTENLIIFDNY
jgi:hypothetical protein